MPDGGSVAMVTIMSIEPEENQNNIPFKDHRFTLCFSLDNVKDPDSPVRGACGKSLSIVVKLRIVLMRVTGQKQDNRPWTPIKLTIMSSC